MCELQIYSACVCVCVSDNNKDFWVESVENIKDCLNHRNCWETLGDIIGYL